MKCRDIQIGYYLVDFESMAESGYPFHGMELKEYNDLSEWKVIDL